MAGLVAAGIQGGVDPCEWEYHKPMSGQNETEPNNALLPSSGRLATMTSTGRPLGSGRERVKATYRPRRHSGSLERQMVRLMKSRPGVARFDYRIDLIQLADLELTLADE